MQVCNFSGSQDVASVHKWGLVDFDWENWRGDGVSSADAGWASAKAAILHGKAPLPCNSGFGNAVWAALLIFFQPPQR